MSCCVRYVGLSGLALVNIFLFLMDLWYLAGRLPEAKLFIVKIPRGSFLGETTLDTIDNIL
jgi:hypothetical protein